MIDFEKDTPVEYSKQSRDYQVFVRTYGALFNQIKMYADMLKNIWSDNIDDSLLLLRSYTLNFIPYYKWENDDLRGTTNNFRYLVRRKGTEAAILDCLRILSRVKGVDASHVAVRVSDNGHVRLLLNEEVVDTGNIEDLLRYILPAGCYYDIIKYSEQEGSAKTDIVVGDEFGYYNNSKLESMYDNADFYLLRNSEQPELPLNNIDYYTDMLITFNEGNFDPQPRIYVTGKEKTYVFDGNTHYVYDPNDFGAKGYNLRISPTGSIDSVNYTGNDNIIKRDVNTAASDYWYTLKFDEDDFEATKDGAAFDDYILSILKNIRLKIDPLDLTITGKTFIAYYDGSEHSAPDNNNFTVTSANSPWEEITDRIELKPDFVNTAKGVEMGVYPLIFTPSDFKIFIKSADSDSEIWINLDSEVARNNINSSIIYGNLIIKQNDIWHLKINGFTKQVYYTGNSEHTSEATYEVSNGLGIDEFTVFNPMATGTDAGVYYSGSIQPGDSRITVPYGYNPGGINRYGLPTGDVKITNTNLTTDWNPERTYWPSNIEAENCVLTIMKAPIENIINTDISGFTRTVEYNGNTQYYYLDDVFDPPGTGIRRFFNSLDIVMTSEYTEATGKDWNANTLLTFYTGAPVSGGGPQPVSPSPGVSGKDAGIYSFDTVMTIQPKGLMVNNFSYSLSLISNIIYPRLIITKRKITITPVLPPRGAHVGEILSFKTNITPTEPGGSGLVDGDKINYRIVTDYTPETPVDTVCSASIELIDTVNSKDKIQYANKNYEITTETITFTVQP